MRKIVFSLLVLSVILLMVSPSFAQGVRGGTSSEGKSSYGSIAVRGLDSDGTDGSDNAGLPGYIEMTSTKGDVFYLYIDYNGQLRMASAASVGFEASPTITGTGWHDGSGVIVGLQVEGANLAP